MGLASFEDRDLIVPRPVSFVYWLDLSVSPPAVLDSKQFPALVLNLRLAGNHLVLTAASDYCCDNDLVFWELGSEPQSLADRPDLPRASKLLAFDGRAAYASGSWYDAEYNLHSGLYVVPWNRIAPAQVVETQTPPTSVAKTNHGLVVGSLDELVTIRPYCGE